MTFASLMAISTLGVLLFVIKRGFDAMTRSDGVYVPPPSVSITDDAPLSRSFRASEDPFLTGGSTNTALNRVLINTTEPVVSLPVERLPEALAKARERTASALSDEQLGEASLAWTRVYQSDPDEIEAHLGWLDLVLIACQPDGEWDVKGLARAEYLYKKALDVHPANAELWAVKALFLQAQGKASLAGEAIKQVRVSSWRSEWLLAECCAVRGEWSSAYEQIQRAYERAPAARHPQLMTRLVAFEVALSADKPD